MARTTEVIPDDIIEDPRRLARESSGSTFVREALVREMAAGYGAEAESPSLDPDWHDTEVEEWGSPELEEGC